jgi:hypothetical protein
VKGRCPRPLDEQTKKVVAAKDLKHKKSKTISNKTFALANITVFLRKTNG